MLSLSAPIVPSSFHEVPFQPEAEYRRLLAPGSGPPLLERLTVAAPVVVPLRPDQAYSDARVAEYFATKSDTYRFALVRIACGFTPPRDELITMAVLEVALGPTSSVQTPRVVDMDPSKIADVHQLKGNTEASVSLEIAGGGTLAFTGKHGIERPDAKLFLVAVGIGQPKVGWEMYDTPTMKIGGIFFFNLIVQTTVGQPASGRIAVRVEVKRKQFGFIPYRAMLDEHPTGQFVCPA